MLYVLKQRSLKGLFILRNLHENVINVCDKSLSKKTEQQMLKQKHQAWQQQAATKNQNTATTLYENKNTPHTTIVAILACGLIDLVLRIYANINQE